MIMKLIDCENFLENQKSLHKLFFAASSYFLCDRIEMIMKLIDSTSSLGGGRGAGSIFPREIFKNFARSRKFERGSKEKCHFNKASVAVSGLSFWKKKYLCDLFSLRSHRNDNEN